MSGLEPQTQALIDAWQRDGAPKPHTMPLEINRTVMSKMAIDCGGPRVAVGKVEDRTIPGPDGPVPVRFYWPSTAAGDLRAGIVFLHGGGFYLGNLETHDHVCRFLCVNSGAVVMAVDYRLAPEHKFPAGAEDSYAALAWLHAHGPEVGIDPDRIGIAGDSAGGTLAVVLCLMRAGRDGPPVRAIASVYPALYLGDGRDRFASRKAFEDGSYFMGEDDIAHVTGMYVSSPAEITNPLVSPVFAEDVSGFPPSLFLAAEFDPCRDECVAFAERLKASGVDAELSVYPGVIHPFYLFDGIFDAGKRGQAQVAAWMAAKLA